MQENENISTYPEEPTNPNDYVGFEKSVYYIFNLLRLMYYSKTESENKFYSKLGGVIGGNVTIQGNLVVNGVNYAIDTTHLNVADYTITLAKDNEQTLTSMVGMVVPKYDGTNYGFFGWDADGYAYVGDLTDYDGSSAITLANNSSLQKIATIDTTNTVVASNGVIYVYDTTSHCFKKPTVDNKYYVIRNGEFVESELFTSEEKSNISKSLYNLGAFDSVSGNTITRQTYYTTLTKADNWTLNGNGTIYYNTKSAGFIVSPSGDNVKGVAYCNKLELVSYDDLYSQSKTSGIAISANGNIAISVSDYANLTSIVVQCKLVSSYEDKVIENTPNIALDQNGANWLQNEWKKGLNLLNVNSPISVTNASITNNTISFNTPANTSGQIKVGAFLNTTAIDWFISNKTSSGFYSATIIKDSSWNMFRFVFSGNNVDGTAIFDLSSIPNGTTMTLSFNLAYSTTNSVISNIMLNSGSVARPYEPPYGEIVHKADIEPVLLWSNPNYASTFNPDEGLDYKQITTLDRSPYKYFKVFVSLGAGNNIFQIITLENNSNGYSTQITMCDNNIIWSREFTFVDNTTIRIGKGVSGSTTNNNRIVPKYIYGTNVL